MNLYIGDTHFGHRNVIGFDHRPFSSVEVDAITAGAFTTVHYK